MIIISIYLVKEFVIIELFSRDLGHVEQKVGQSVKFCSLFRGKTVEKEQKITYVTHQSHVHNAPNNEDTLSHANRLGIIIFPKMSSKNVMIIWWILEKYHKIFWIHITDTFLWFLCVFLLCEVCFVLLEKVSSLLFVV